MAMYSVWVQADDYPAYSAHRPDSNLEAQIGRAFLEAKKFEGRDFGSVEVWVEETYGPDPGQCYAAWVVTRGKAEEVTDNPNIPV